MKRNRNEIAHDVATNPYAWPGGYPKFALTDDGGTLCYKCCRDHAEDIDDSTGHDGWHVVGMDVNWESLLFCDSCGCLIDSAYGKVDIVR